MLISTHAIVLSKIKYRDNDIILKCYTEDFGLKSYLIRGAFKAKNKKFKPAYLQPLSQLFINANHKQNRSLHSLSEMKLALQYDTLYTDVLKGSIVMFLSETLSLVIKEEEPDKPLYSYISASLQWLDHSEKYANFHLLFLLKITKYLGFYPETYQEHHHSFNLEAGKFEVEQTNAYSISGNNLTLLKQLLGTKFDTLDEVKISSKQRQDFLSMILLYFELHLGGFKKPKSLQIFNQIFN